MNRILAVTLLSVLGGGMSFAYTGPFVSISPEASLFLTASATAKYDDNVYLTPSASPSASTGDGVFVLMPGLDFQYSGGTTKAAVTLLNQMLRYIDSSNLDEDLLSLSSDLTYEGARTYVNCKMGYQEYNQTTYTNNVSDQITGTGLAIARRNQSTASFYTVTSMTAKTRVGVGGRFERWRYPNGQPHGFIDNENAGVPLDLYYSMTPKLDISMGYRYRRSTVANGLTNAKNHFVNLGAKGEFTPKLGGQLRLGLNQNNYDNGQSEAQFGVDVGLTYVYSPKLSFELNTTNDFRSSAYGISTRSLNVDLTTYYQITPEWDARLGLTYISTTYGANVSEYDFNDGRKDNYYVGTVSVSYAITRSFMLRAEYLYRTNSTNALYNYGSNTVPDLRNLGFDNSTISVTASVRF